ncbi:hypothetical protein Tco_0364564 [Tanacetum coccineum]
MKEGDDVGCTSLQVYDWVSPRHVLNCFKTNNNVCCLSMSKISRIPKDSPFHLEAFSDSDYAGGQPMKEDQLQCTANPTQSTAFLRRVLLRQQSTVLRNFSESTVIPDLLFDDENGVFDLLPKQSFGTCSEILATRTLHGNEFRTDIASALVGTSIVFEQAVRGEVSQHLQQEKNIVLVLILKAAVLQGMLKALQTSKSSSPFQRTASVKVRNQNLKKQKRRRKKHKKKVSSVKLGRNKDEGTLSEEHNVQEEDTTHPFFDDIADQDAAVTPDLERKSDETEEVNIEEKEASNVKSGETEELDLETTQSTARQGTITPRTLNFEDEAGPSSPLRPIQIMESEEHLKAAEVLVAISRPRGLSIPGPIQSQPQQPTQGTDTQDALELQMMRMLPRKIQADGMRRRTERAPIKDSFKRLYPMEFEKERGDLKERDAKRLSRKRKATIAEE